MSINLMYCIYHICSVYVNILGVVIYHLGVFPRRWETDDIFRCRYDDYCFDTDVVYSIYTCSSI